MVDTAQDDRAHALGVVALLVAENPPGAPLDLVADAGGEERDDSLLTELLGDVHLVPRKSGRASFGSFVRL